MLWAAGAGHLAAPQLDSSPVSGGRTAATQPAWISPMWPQTMPEGGPYADHAQRHLTFRDFYPSRLQEAILQLSLYLEPAFHKVGLARKTKYNGRRAGERQET